jgi:Ca-activated chloride channel family protein
MHGRIGITEMSIQPIFPVGTMLAVFAVLFGITAYLVVRNRTRAADRALTLLRMTMIYVLALIIGLRPVLVETKYEFATKNLDVLFIMDNTISMWAQDYSGKKERMSGANKDVNYIMNQLAGSNFALVTFDDSAHVLSPFTQDMQYIRDLMDTFEKPDSYYAKGSDLSIPYQDIESLLLSSSRKENRKTIVFYISDGEITNGKELRDYSGLAQYIDSGAVLGYGSAQGGKMKDGYGSGYVYDYSAHRDAISVIDEDNLKKIAEDMGLEYMNMNSGNSALQGVVEIIRESSKTVIETGKGAEVTTDIYYFFAYPLILMILIEIVMVARRGRL